MTEQHSRVRLDTRCLVAKMMNASFKSSVSDLDGCLTEIFHDVNARRISVRRGDDMIAQS